jgi:hypothetical protein
MRQLYHGPWRQQARDCVARQLKVAYTLFDRGKRLLSTAACTDSWVLAKISCISVTLRAPEEHETL